MTQEIKKVVCESCGSNDLEYKDGLIVCKRCGTKYTITGLQNVNKYQNLFVLARRAKETKEYDRAEEYYEQILLDDPYNLEAEYNVKLCSFLKAGSGKRVDRLRLLGESFDVLGNLISLINDPEERKRAIISINDEIVEILKDYYLNADRYEVYDRDVEMDDSEYAFSECLENADYLRVRATEAIHKWVQALTKHVCENEEISKYEDTQYVWDIVIEGYKLFANMTEGIKTVLWKFLRDEKAEDWINKAVTVIHKYDTDFVVEDFDVVGKKEISGITE